MVRWVRLPQQVGSIMVALLHSMCDLKGAQMNVQHRLTQELMLYKFELGQNTTEATKNICFMKSEGSVGHSTETR